MNETSTHITAIASGDGEHLTVAGGQYRILVSGQDTEGKYAIIEMNVPPGGGPPPHAHPEVEELFYVAEGELEFKTESGATIAAQGAFVRIALYGGIHAFKNRGDKPARLLCTVMPAGMDEMFKEASTATPDQLPGIMKKYKQVMYPPDYLDKNV